MRTLLVAVVRFPVVICVILPLLLLDCLLISVRRLSASQAALQYEMQAFYGWVPPTTKIEELAISIEQHLPSV